MRLEESDVSESCRTKKSWRKVVGESRSQNVSVPSIPSFTPINSSYGSAPFSHVNPLDTRRDRALDFEAYNTPGIEKTTRVQAKRRRRTSEVGELWPFQEEEDMAYQTQTRGSLKKRPKTLLAKRTQSAKPVAQTLEKPWDDKEAFSVMEVATDLRISNTQLFGPPDTSKRQQVKTTRTLKPANKGHKMRPFKNPVIAKPNAITEPNKQQKGGLSPTEPVINHLGWTTTQEAVKLSKTTLDRLASFRYTNTSNDTPSAESNERPSVLSTLSHSDMNREELVIISQEFVHEHVQPPMISDSQDRCDHAHRDPPLDHPQHIYNIGNGQTRNEDFFGDAIWDGADPVDRITDQPTDRNPSYEHSTGYNGLALHQNIDCSQFLEVKDGHEGGDAEPPQALILHQISMAENNHQSPSFEQPTSSETRAMEELVDVISREVNPLAQHISQKPDASTSKEDHGQSENVQSLAGPLNETKDFREPDYNVKKQYLDDFDFGDDIDDEDLIELNSLLNIQEIASGGVISHSNTEHSREQTTWADEPLSNSHNNRISIQGDGFRENQTSSVADLELDDEYPLDDDCEQEMLNLQGCADGMVENFGISTNFKDQASDKVFGRPLQHSPPRSPALISPRRLSGPPCTDIYSNTRSQSTEKNQDSVILIDKDIDWSFLDIDYVKPSLTNGSQTRTPAASPLKSQHTRVSATREMDQNLSRTKNSQSSPIDLTHSLKAAYILDDSHEYEPLLPFARPDFPRLMRDRSPVVGLSIQCFLRVCFHVGEMFKEGGRCNALNQNAVIELYARVTFSSREPGTTKQHFQFADLWHNRPPYPAGLLANYKTSGLADTESRVFVGASESIMARCLGTFKKNGKSAAGWLLHIISIRETDWEEIRWTKRIVSAGLVKSER